ncbi:MAG TPA: hypothetical protein DIC59_15870 [Candidatus Competibacteraceae bacterium]|nr:hypothetical protein [Candidatus Competibacteraceae bacterium]
MSGKRRTINGKLCQDRAACWNCRDYSLFTAIAELGPTGLAVCVGRAGALAGLVGLGPPVEVVVGVVAL